MAINRTYNQKTRKKSVKRNWINLVKKWAIRLVVGFFAITILWVLALKFINPPITYLMIQRGFEWKKEGKGFKIEKEWLDYNAK